MIASGAVCIAYETVELADRTLPLLTPMSEVAGRMAIQVGAYYLGKPQGGKGKLLGGEARYRTSRLLQSNRLHAGLHKRRDFKH